MSYFYASRRRRKKRPKEPVIRLTLRDAYFSSSSSDTDRRRYRKPNCNIVFLGHVDCGKSTLIGRYIERQMECQGRTEEMAPIKQRSINDGKPSFFHAFLTDDSYFERARGITMDNHATVIEERDQMMSLLSTPGHCDGWRNSLRVIGDAHVAVFVLSARPGMFEASASTSYVWCNPSLRFWLISWLERCRAARKVADEYAKGATFKSKEEKIKWVSRITNPLPMIIAVNKLDHSNDRDKRQDLRLRFEFICNEFRKIMSEVGFNEDQIKHTPIIPISCMNHAINLWDSSEDDDQLSGNDRMAATMIDSSISTMKKKRRAKTKTFDWFNNDRGCDLWSIIRQKTDLVHKYRWRRRDLLLLLKKKTSDGCDTRMHGWLQISQIAFSKHQKIFIGTVREGTLTVGETVWINEQRVKIVSLQTHGFDLKTAIEGDLIGMTFDTDFNRTRNMRGRIVCSIAPLKMTSVRCHCRFFPYRSQRDGEFKFRLIPRLRLQRKHINHQLSDIKRGSMTDIRFRLVYGFVREHRDSLKLRIPDELTRIILEYAVSRISVEHKLFRRFSTTLDCFIGSQRYLCKIPVPFIDARTKRDYISDERGFVHQSQFNDESGFISELMLTYGKELFIPSHVPCSMHTVQTMEHYSSSKWIFGHTL